jgi:hypothetical protein
MVEAFGRCMILIAVLITFCPDMIILKAPCDFEKKQILAVDWMVV